MSIKFCDSHLRLEKFVRAVYKLIFNEKWYYIGSSINLKVRISQWKTRLQQDGFNKNSSMKFILPEVTDVRYEILEMVEDGVWVKEREKFYLDKCFEDELCLNITSDTINGKGRKLALGKLPKEKKIRGLPTTPKPIAQFDGGGNLVAKYASTNEASRRLRVKTNKITSHMNGRGQKHIKGFILKYIDKDGNFLDHEIYKNNIPKGRKFYQINGNGDVVAEHYNLASAARAIGNIHLSKNIGRVLNGEYRYKSCKGFKWKYA